MDTNQTIFRLYLVQHGLAVSDAVDPARPLSDDGRKDVECIAHWAGERIRNIRQIQHSGKLRAEQTANILAESLKPVKGVVKVAGLAPNDDVSTFARLEPYKLDNIIIVGHLPFLSRLCGQLVAGSSDTEPVKFTNSGIVSLERDNTGWSVTWVMPVGLFSA